MFTNVSKIKLYIETKNYNKNMSVLPELRIISSVSKNFRNFNTTNLKTNYNA